jgi:hypothetical protein
MNTAQKIVTILSIIVIATATFYVAQPAKAAVTAQSLMDQIASLKAQIAVLEQQLFNIQQTQPPTWCYTFNRNLRIGEHGTAVTNLQIALSKEGLYTLTNGNASGTFDEGVASAVVAFQEKYASEILTPNGLAHGTGYVGLATRTKLNALYGCNNNGNNGRDDLVINNVSGPATIGINQTGTWMVNASDPDDNMLSYSVNWGDQVSTPSPMATSYPNTASQLATFTHVYGATGNYTITFHITDSEGNVATNTMQVSVVTQANLPPVANSQSVTVNENSSAQITLTGSDPNGNPLTYTVVSSTAHGTLSGTAPNLAYTPNANFTGNDSFMFKVNDGSVDSNNVATVSITVSPFPVTVQPVINGISGPVSLAVNQTGTWTVNATESGNNPLNYSVNWGDGLQNGIATSTSAMASSSQTATFTHMYAATGNYTVTFHVTDTTGATATSTISVMVHAY